MTEQKKQRRYTCGDCGRSFTVDADTQTYMDGCSPDEFLSCPWCDNNVWGDEATEGDETMRGK